MESFQLPMLFVDGDQLHKAMPICRFTCIESILDILKAITVFELNHLGKFINHTICIF